jgi:hypothetical protein
MLSSLHRGSGVARPVETQKGEAAAVTENPFTEVVSP